MRIPATHLIVIIPFADMRFGDHSEILVSDRDDDKSFIEVAAEVCI